jgi:NAD(P)-dependent dehydrogenase (short-subunit alcohol dehydrogenase family)
MDLQLAGRSALVTGASSGIGRAIALELGREGVRLAITGRRRANLDEVASRVCAMGVAFLASPRAAYITGTVIPVDGGLRRYQF